MTYVYAVVGRRGVWIRTPASRQVQYVGTADALQAAVQPYGALRMLGVRTSAPWICWAVERGYRMEVAGVRAVRVGTATAPAAVLSRMEDCRVPAAYGGWHVVTSVDLATYRMLTSPDQAAVLAVQHPVMRYLLFIPGLDLAAVSRLLCEVIDPRWYVVPEHPYRVATLQAYLGVSPRNLWELRRGDARRRSTARLQLVRQAWVAGEHYPLTMPGNFLQRIYVRGGCTARSCLRACRRFVLYLHHAWLQVLHEASYGYPNQMFIPEAFFASPEEIVAFREHLRTWDQAGERV